MTRHLALLLIVVLSSNLFAREGRLFNGFDGGMMIHTGYLKGNFLQLDYPVSGMPFGIGGVIRVHFGNHWRIGSEGYVSTLEQSGNGSYVKYGWGGLLVDFHWACRRFVPYAGLTVGGGVNTNLLIQGDTSGDWEPVRKTYYNSFGFLAIDPFAGCDYVVSEAFHLTMKADWLNCISKKCSIPSGPRLYLGFIFYH